MQLNIHDRSLVARSGDAHTVGMKKAKNSAGVKRGAKTDTAARGPYFSPESLLERGTAGVYLRQWRAHRNMTIAALAEKAGVAEGTITGIENEEIGFTNSTLAKLAKALECSIAELFGKNPLANTDLWIMLDGATAEQRRIIEDHAKIVLKRDL